MGKTFEGWMIFEDGKPESAMGPKEEIDYWFNNRYHGNPGMTKHRVRVEVIDEGGE